MIRRWRRWATRQRSRLAIVHVSEPRITLVPSGLVAQTYRTRIRLVDQGPWL